MNINKNPTTFLGGLLFSFSWLAIISVFTPAIVDGIFSGLVLIIIPALALYYIGVFIARASGIKSIGFAILLLTVLMIPVLMVITSYNLLFGLVIASSGLVHYYSYSRRIPAITLSLLFLFFSAYLGLSRQVIESTPKMLVFGADAMKITIVDSLIAGGELPVMKKLIDEGASGPLKSQPPLLSAIIWTTIASGYGKDVHGITNFYFKSNQVAVPRIWHMMEQNGWDAGVFRWLVTWPPEKLRGFCVPDIIARDDSSYPPGYGALNTLRDLMRTSNSPNIVELSQTCWKLIERGVQGRTILVLAVEGLQLNTKLRDEKFKYRFFRHADMELSADLFLNLLQKERPEFAVFYDNAIDLTGHKFWHYYEPQYFEVEAEEAGLYGNFVTDMYRCTDSILGRIVDKTGGDTKVIVVSDHGMKPVSEAGNKWYWVNSEQLLADLGIGDKVLTQLVANQQLVYPVMEADSVNYLDILKNNFNRIKKSDGSVFYYLGRNEVGDWYIYPQDFSCNEMLYLDGQPVNPDRYRESFSLFGEHSLYGTVIISGENIKHGMKLENASILDITPTILHWAGMPVAESMEGRVLREVFIDPGKIEYGPDYELPVYLQREKDLDMEADEETKDKLRSMGYVK